jgi:hypothetical protein
MSIAVFSIVWAIVSIIIAVGIFFSSIIIDHVRGK